MTRTAVLSTEHKSASEHHSRSCSDSGGVSEGKTKFPSQTQGELEKVYNDGTIEDIQINSSILEAVIEMEIAILWHIH